MSFSTLPIEIETHIISLLPSNGPSYRVNSLFLSITKTRQTMAVIKLQRWYRDHRIVEDKPPFQIPLTRLTLIRYFVAKYETKELEYLLRKLNDHYDIDIYPSLSNVASRFRAFFRNHGRALALLTYWHPNQNISPTCLGSRIRLSCMPQGVTCMPSELYRYPECRLHYGGIPK